MNKSIKEKLVFLVKENLIIAVSAIIILISIFSNITLLIWVGVAVYIFDIILKNYILKLNKKKNQEKKEGKVIKFDFIDKKIK